MSLKFTRKNLRYTTYKYQLDNKMSYVLVNRLYNGITTEAKLHSIFNISRKLSRIVFISSVRYIPNYYTVNFISIYMLTY